MFGKVVGLLSLSPFGITIRLCLFSNICFLAYTNFHLINVILDNDENTKLYESNTHTCVPIQYHYLI